MPEFFRCKCGWQMSTVAARAIAAHNSRCWAAPKPERKPIDIDRVIDDAARGKSPARPLNQLERIAVFDRLMTMDPGEMFERVFRQPLLEELDAMDTKDEAEHPEDYREGEVKS